MNGFFPFVLTVLVWVVCGVVVGWSYARRPWQTMLTCGVITSLRRWERRDFYERVLRVRAWKDMLPEAGTWFGGISKRSLPRHLDGGLQRFVAESLRAERVHLAYLLCIVVTMSWTRGWWLFLTFGFAIAVNVPCIVVARYNRIRLAHLA
jgi:glycosyl-4,4'-diaponeurosporenoate acyltransferase